MRVETLERLLDAGFSKDEIMQLARDEPQEQPAPQDQQKPEEPPEPTDQTEPAGTDPEPAQIPDNNTNFVVDKLNGLEKKFNDLIKTMQAQNLKNNYVDSRGDDLETQTDKIMQSIIRPEVKKKE